MGTIRLYTYIPIALEEPRSDSSPHQWTSTAQAIKASFHRPEARRGRTNHHERNQHHRPQDQARRRRIERDRARGEESAQRHAERQRVEARAARPAWANCRLTGWTNERGDLCLYCSAPQVCNGNRGRVEQSAASPSSATHNPSLSAVDRDAMSYRGPPIEHAAAIGRVLNRMFV